MTCSGRNAVIRNALVATVLRHALVSPDAVCDMTWSRKSFIMYPEHNLTTYPGWKAVLPCTDHNTVLHHASFRKWFYDIHGSERSFTTFPGWDAVLRHTRVGMQFHDLTWSRHSFTACLVEKQFNGITAEFII